MKKVVLALLLLFIIFTFQPSSIQASENAAIGVQKTVVILAKFPDIENEHTPAYIDNLVFGEVNDFLGESSYGQLWLTGTTTSVWYELPNTLDYYAKENVKVPPYQGIIRDVFELASSEVDLNGYDRAILILPKFTWLRDIALWNPIAKMGVAIDSFHECIPIAHEYTHVLGYPTPQTLYPLPPDWPLGWENEWGFGWWLHVPDLYPNVVDWSLMGGASAHHLAWEKMRLGWIPPTRVLTVGLGEMATTWIDPLEISTDNIQVIKIPLSGEYYLLVEVRQKIGFDENITHGVVVSFTRDYGYYENWKFSVNRMPRTIIFFSPAREGIEWYLRLGAQKNGPTDNRTESQADVYIDGKYVGKVWEELPEGGVRTIVRKLVGAHLISVSENDNYGTPFGGYSRGTFGQIMRPVGPGSPGMFTEVELGSTLDLSAYYLKDEDVAELLYGPLFIIGYYAFQEGDRISFPDLDLTITMLEEENGSYLIRVGPAPSIQHDDAGSGGDAGERGLPLEISPGSYRGYLGVSSADYRDFYEIDAVQGQEVKVSMTPLTSGNTWIRLYDTKDYDVGAPDSGWVADGGENHMISYTAPSTGSLYLGVFRSSGMAEYQLDVSLSDIPTELASASPRLELELGESKTLTATLARLDGVPLAGKSVTWSAEAGEATFLNEVTDDRGQVSITYTATTVRPKVTIKASFEGGDNHENSACQFEVTLLTGVGPKNLVSDAWLLVENVEAGEKKVVEVENGDLRRITLISAGALDNLELRVQQADAPPSEVVPPSGEIYSYFNVLSTATENDIENVQFEFRVDRSWFSEHGIDLGSIALCRYENGEWKGLQTRLISEDNSYFYYSAFSPGLSVFAITGEQAFPLLPLIAVLVLIIVIALVTAYWLKFSR